MFSKKEKVDKRGTWGSGIGSLLLAVLIAFAIRWAFVEAYVIPSGSMLPTLLLNDHIFVDKFTYGIRIPFSKNWIKKFRTPDPGEIVIFKYPVDESTFFIKRVIGTPGDKITWDGNQLTINGKIAPTQPHPDANYYFNLVPEEDFREGKEYYKVFEEKVGEYKHPIFVMDGVPHRTITELEVPPDALFVMGDNRDQSNDSRGWGFVPMDNILGRAMFVWLSCSEPIPVVKLLCNPLTIRWTRFFHSVH